MALNSANITITGTLASNPELNHTTSGKPVTNIRLACKPRRYNYNTGAWVDQTTIFVTATAWGRTAENIYESLRSGHRVIVAGKIKQTEWEKDGETRYGWEIDIDEIGASLAFNAVSINRRAQPSEDVPSTSDPVASKANNLDRFLPVQDQWSSFAAPKTKDDPF